MTPVSIQIERERKQMSLYRALSGTRQTVGRTPGEALDALLAQEGETMESSSILIQRFGPDAYFTQEQHDRMQQLLARRDALNIEESAELDRLIDAELEATIQRTDALVKQMQP